MRPQMRDHRIECQRGAVGEADEGAGALAEPLVRHGDDGALAHVGVAVEQLLDLDHRSHIDQIDRALTALGKRLEVRVLQAA